MKEIKQFDLVQIRTTKNIKYLSSEKGCATSPHGNWSVVGFIKREALLSKQGSLVRVPVSDLILIGEFYSPI